MRKEIQSFVIVIIFFLAIFWTSGDIHAHAPPPTSSYKNISFSSFKIEGDTVLRLNQDSQEILANQIFPGPDLSQDEDVITLREALKRHEPSITIERNYDTEPTVQEIGKILMNAMGPTENGDEGDYLKYIVKSVHTDIKYYYSDGYYKTAIGYKISYYQTLNEEKYVQKKLDKIKKLLKGKDKKNQCVIIGMELSKMLDYDKDLEKSSFFPGKALKKGKGTCGVYATLYYRLATECGIPCRMMVGNVIRNGENIKHAWDVLKIDGKLYFVDATWYDSSYIKNEETHQYPLLKEINVNYPK